MQTRSSIAFLVSVVLVFVLLVAFGMRQCDKQLDVQSAQIEAFQEGE
jgi:hypothetical protein